LPCSQAAYVLKEFIVLQRLHWKYDALETGSGQLQHHLPIAKMG